MIRELIYNKVGGWIFTTPREVFDIKGGVCIDQSTFGVNCLVSNGYYGPNFYRDFGTHKNYAACGLGASDSSTNGHAVILYVRDGKFYTIDNVLLWNSGIRGPYDTIEKAADATFSGWKFYEITNDISKLIKTVYRK
jgi:hypothetical protein